MKTAEPKKTRKAALKKGELHGVRYTASPAVDTREIAYLCAKLEPIVRGRVLRGTLTLTFRPGPGVPDDAA